jgi:hypothetical protein
MKREASEDASLSSATKEGRELGKMLLGQFYLSIANTNGHSHKKEAS